LIRRNNILTLLATQCIVLTVMSTVINSIGCVDGATEILGDKWTPQLLRYFINERSVRFCQLQDLTKGINPRTLSARLSHLEEQGIIVKNATHSSRCEYTLTEKGYDLLPVLKNMQAWSDKYMITNV
jgi:DNA-binding HxlR family transcriptional regulator